MRELYIKICGIDRYCLGATLSKLKNQYMKYGQKLFNRAGRAAQNLYQYLKCWLALLQMATRVAHLLAINSTAHNNNENSTFPLLLFDFRYAHTFARKQKKRTFYQDRLSGISFSETKRIYINLYCVFKSFSSPLRFSQTFVQSVNIPNHHYCFGLKILWTKFGKQPSPLPRLFT